MQSTSKAAQPDELIDFAHLKARSGLSQLELEDEVATDLQRATGLANADGADASRLSRVLQLSGAICPAPATIEQVCPIQVDLLRVDGLANADGADASRLSRVLQLSCGPVVGEHVSATCTGPFVSKPCIAS